MPAPHIVVIGGPNGAGKSTAAPAVVRDLLGVDDFVNADTIAAGLSAFDPAGSAIEAGRIMLRRLDELARRRIDFAFETTLASRTYARWIDDRRRDGHRVHLLYLRLPSAEQAVARVADRVARGGHAIPEDVVRRRWQRGLTNLEDLYLRRVDSCHAVDVSRPERPTLLREEVSPATHAALRDPDRLLDAFWHGVREAIREHRREGRPMVSWEGGRVAWIPADELPDVEPGL